MKTIGKIFAGCGGFALLVIVVCLVMCCCLVVVLTMMGGKQVNADVSLAAVAPTRTLPQPQASPTPVVIEKVVTATPMVVEPTAQPMVPTAAVQAAVPSGDWPNDLFRTPVECQKAFNVASSWLICEPGVILDATAAWTIPGTDEVWHINVPEGGFTYFSMGEGNIIVDGVSLHLPGEKGLNYLVVLRGRIDDTVVDSDLNETAWVSDFVPGHAIWSIMPPGAYVSHNWFRDQLVVSTTTTGTNCGATGCSRTKIVLFDVDSHFKQVFEVHAGDLDNWISQ